MSALPTDPLAQPAAAGRRVRPVLAALALMLMASSLGGCVIAPYPGYAGYYRPYYPAYGYGYHYWR